MRRGPRRCETPPGGPVDALPKALEHASVRHSIENLETFPFIKERLAIGQLRLRGAYFDIADGRLFALDPEGGRFGPLDRCGAYADS